MFEAVTASLVSGSNFLSDTHVSSAQFASAESRFL